MPKNIWIINEYAGCPKYEGLYYRHYYLAKEFNKLNNHTTVISSSFSHILHKFPAMEGKKYKKEIIDEVDFLWIKTLKYKKSFDKKRILKWFGFMWRLFFISKYIDNKPDVILCSPTAPLSILPAYFLAKKHKAKLVFEVRDIWPLTLIEIGGFSKSHPFILLLNWFEKFALKKADVIVSNLSNYQQHLNNIVKNKTAHWISNGINLDDMQNIKPIDESVINKIPQDKFIIGYTGKFGVSNNLQLLVKVAHSLKDNSNIAFVLVGGGQERDNLKNQAKDLENVIFIEPIKKSQVQPILALFNACFIGWKNEDLYKYGVSPNKIFDYMYAAKPILHSINTTNDIITQCNCGMNIQAENVDGLQKAILELYNMPIEQRKQLGGNGKRCVVSDFTYDNLAKKYLSIMD
jgi:glycosyltransferase involved in cell wall biosynthesis